MPPSASAPRPDAAPAAAWSFRQAGQLDGEQKAALDKFHSRMATALARMLTEYLHFPVELSVEEPSRLVFRDWVRQLPVPTYMAAIALGVEAAHAIVQMERAIALALIDVALGGPGEPVTAVREPTAIEEQMLAGIVAKLAEAMQSEWPADLGLNFQFRHHLPSSEAFQTIHPEDKVFVFGFAVRFGNVSGRMVWVTPADVSYSLLRSLVQPATYRRARSGGEARALQRERMGAARFALELVMPPARVPMRRLLELHEGYVLALPHSTECPAELRVAGKLLFEAQPIRHLGNRAALIKSIVRATSQSEVLES